MKFAKIVFWVAGIYGLLVITPLYFMFERVGQTSPPAITHPEYYYGFVGTAFAWQLAFLVIATDPARYRPLIFACMVEKFSFLIAVYVLYAQHRIGTQILAFGSIDGLLGILFVASFFALRGNRKTV